MFDFYSCVVDCMLDVGIWLMLLEDVERCYPPVAHVLGQLSGHLGQYRTGQGTWSGLGVEIEREG